MRDITFVAILLLITSHVQADETFKVSLSAQPSYSTGSEVKLNLTLSNLTKETQDVLKWQTPFEGFRSKMFRVTRDGLDIPYQGIRVRRSSPSKSDYMSLGAGESISIEVELSQAYDLSQPGNYEVQFISSLSYGTQFVEIESNKVFFIIQNKSKSTFLEDEGIAKPLELSFDNCSDEQKEKIEQVINNVKECVESALTKIEPENEIYKRWFGEAAHQTVKDNFNNIQTVFNTEMVNGKGLVFNCQGPECKENYYAYVYPTGNTIYLCQTYWNVGMGGYDSQADTLVHEVSHFNSVAETNDYRYGQCPSQDLARNYPQKAANNADNYGYFSANACGHKPAMCNACCFVKETITVGNETYYRCTTEETVDVCEERKDYAGVTVSNAQCEDKYKCCTILTDSGVNGLSITQEGKIVDGTCQTKLSVELSSFSITKDETKRVVEWETASETNNLGMNLWCAQMQGNQFQEITQLNSQLIPNKAILPNYGASYSSTDYPYINTNLKPGVQHCTLEDIDASGQCTLHCDQIDTVVVGEGNNLSDTELNELQARAIALCNEHKQNGMCLDQLLAPNQ